MSFLQSSTTTSSNLYSEITIFISPSLATQSKYSTLPQTLPHHFAPLFRLLTFTHLTFLLSTFHASVQAR
jgi:hypothetical protein